MAEVFMGDAGMDEQEIKPTGRRRRTGCLVAVGIVLVLVGAFVAYRVYLRSRVNAELQAIRDAGYPVTPEELDAWYPEPQGENAADVLLEAFDLLVEHDEEMAAKLPVVGQGELPPRGEPLPDEMKKAIAAHLAANSEALELLREGARMKECRYPIDLTTGILARLGPMSRIRQAARLFALEALFHAEEGRGEAAADSIAACMGMGRSLAMEPLVISQFVRIACYAIAVDNLQRVLSRIPLTDAQLVELASVVGDAEDPELMTRALVGERTTIVGVFETMRERPSFLSELDAVPGSPLSPLDTDLGANVASFLYVASGLLARDELTYLKLMKEAVSITGLPFSQQPVGVKALEGERRKLGPLTMISAVSLPGIEGLAECHLRSAAQLRAARTALAVERYRLAHGTLPDKLAELVPEYLDGVPEDPYDGNPLRYRKLPRGYVVYSIGLDGKDDGGAEETLDGVGEAPDETFTVER